MRRVAVGVVMLFMIINTLFVADGRHLKLQQQRDDHQNLEPKKHYETNEYNHHGCYRSDYNCWSNRKETRE